MKLGPGVSARIPAGRAGSWSLAAGPRDPRAGVRRDWFQTQLGMGSGVSQSLHWPASDQGWAPAGPSVESGLGPQAAGLWWSSVGPLQGEAGLEASGGFMGGRASACPLVGRAGSWSSGGQGPYLNCV